MAKYETKREGEETSEKVHGKEAEELKTDFPMSEKDEVKQAEQNTNKKQDKNR